MKIKKTILILTVFVLILMFLQNVMAQEVERLISKNLTGKSSEVMSNGKQLFYITVGDPSVNVMKEATNSGDKNIWFIVLQKGNQEGETETKDQVNMEDLLPESFVLGQNYPNPFNPTTTIDFHIPRLDGVENVRTVIKIYDLLGRLVKTLVDENLTPGHYARFWNGIGDHGEKISSGLYFYTIKSGDFSKTKTMLMLK